MTGQKNQKHTSVTLSFVIINWNTRHLLIQCLKSIETTCASIRHDIWVVDNGSTDGSVEQVRKQFPGVQLIANKENKGFAAANNQALKQIKGRYAVLLNSDARLTKGAANILLDFMEHHPETAMACGQLIYPDGRLQNSVASFPSLLSLIINESLLKRLMPERYVNSRRQRKETIEVDSCIGACLIIRKSAMDEVGRLDERYFFFFEETDWARQFSQSGWKVFFVPQAKIIHDQGQSAGDGAVSRILFIRSRYQYLKKWHPHQFGAMVAVIWTRLAINLLVNMVGALVTFGLINSIRNRFSRYLKICRWHFTESYALKHLKRPYKL